MRAGRSAYLDVQGSSRIGYQDGRGGVSGHRAGVGKTDTAAMVIERPDIQIDKESKMHAGEGLTLTELMVVVLIVSILAGVSLPIMQRRIDEAKWTEGRTIMGTIAKSLRAHIAEKGSAFSRVPRLSELGFWEGDLDGTFFKGGESGVGNFSWVINSNNPVDFLITATAPDGIGGPAVCTLDDTGTYKDGLVNQTGKSVGENSGDTSESAAGGPSTYLPGNEAQDSTNTFGTRPGASAQTYYDPNSLGIAGGSTSSPDLK